MQQNNDHSQCILLALCVCALGRGLPEKVLGLGQPRGGGGVPPPPLRRGVGVPPPPYSPPNCRTPLGVTHWLAAAPVAATPSAAPPPRRSSKHCPPPAEDTGPPGAPGGRVMQGVEVVCITRVRPLREQMGARCEDRSRQPPPCNAIGEDNPRFSKYCTPAIRGANVP